MDRPGGCPPRPQRRYRASVTIHYLPQMILCVVVPVMILATVVWLDWLAALFLLLSAPLIPLFMALVGMGAEKLNQQHMETLGRLSGHFLDRLRGLTTLQLFQYTEAATEGIAKATEEYRRINLKTLRVAFLSSAVLEFFASVAIAVIAIYIGFGLLGYIRAVYPAAGAGVLPAVTATGPALSRPGHGPGGRRAATGTAGRPPSPGTGCRRTGRERKPRYGGPCPPAHRHLSRWPHGAGSGVPGDQHGGTGATGGPLRQRQDHPAECHGGLPRAVRGSYQHLRAISRQGTLRLAGTDAFYLFRFLGR